MKKISWDGYREAVGESTTGISIKELKEKIGDTLKTLKFKDSYFDGAYMRSRNGKEYVIRLRSGSGPLDAREDDKNLRFYGVREVVISDPTG